MNQLFEWLARYNRREQSLLLSGALVVFVYILWKGLLVPLQDWRQEQMQANQRASQTLEQVRLLSARLEQAKARSEAQPSSRGTNISSLVDSSLRDKGLDMSGFQPGTGGQVRVRLDEVPFAPFMQWLYDVEYQHGLSVVDFSMSGTQAAGRVTANIRLQQN